MNRSIKILLIIVSALVVFAALIYAKMYLAKHPFNTGQAGTLKTADIPQLQNELKKDSLYNVKDVFYRDSSMLIAVSNPDKTGTDQYFNNKYQLNGYSNIEMVYIFQYDSLHPLQAASPEDALMATGKRLGRFQEQWVGRYIDSSDKSCIPLKKYLQDKMKHPDSFKNQETTYQPASIYKMEVVCKYRVQDSIGNSLLNQVVALIDTGGNIISVK